MKILKFLTLLPVLFILVNSCQVKNNISFEDYKWEVLECNSEPVARHEAAFVEFNDKFYLLGGRRIQVVSIFNPVDNTWTSGAKPPVELHHFQGISYKGKLLVVGAQSGKYPHEVALANAYWYDPVKDIWEKGFEMPVDRHRGATTASIYKDKLYIAGGIIDGHWDGHVFHFDSYDFKTGEWEILPDIPRYRDHANSALVNDKLYLIGGRKTSRITNEVLELTEAKVDVFDFNTEEWSTLENPVLTQRAGCTAIAIGDNIILTGGESATQVAAHNEVEMLDTKTGTWSTLPDLMIGRHGTQLIWHEEKLYIASGCSERGGSTESTTIESFSK